MSGARVLVVATHNRGKLVEFQRLLADLPGVELRSLDQVSPVPEVVEDRDTFEDNAAKKAVEVAELLGLPVLADDSGLEVDALGGDPGVRSARFAGEPSDSLKNNQKLLALLAQTPDDHRTARFRCVLAFADPAGAMAGRVHLQPGACEGRIAREPRGEHGFGYDPVFVPRGENRSMAELSPAEKDARSHRARAAQALLPFLQGYFQAP